MNGIGERREGTSRNQVTREMTVKLYSVQTWSNIHVAVNLLCLALLEVAAGFALWRIIPNRWIWGATFFAVFWGLAFVGHRYVPRITGPASDRLFPTKEDPHNKSSE